MERKESIKTKFIVLFCSSLSALSVWERSFVRQLLPTGFAVMLRQVPPVSARLRSPRTDSPYKKEHSRTL